MAPSQATRRTWPTSLVALVLAACLTGCTRAAHRIVASPVSHRSDYIDVDNATKEYRDAERNLRLNPGWKWPTVPEPRVGPDGRPQLYEIGTATNDAQLYWYCSWASGLATNPGADVYDVDLEKMSTVRGMHLY